MYVDHDRYIFIILSLTLLSQVLAPIGDALVILRCLLSTCNLNNFQPQFYKLIILKVTSVTSTVSIFCVDSGQNSMQKNGWISREKTLTRRKS